MGLGNATQAEMRDPKAPKRRDWKDTTVFPNYAELWTNCETWIRAHGAGANKGNISGAWFNESMDSPTCPARISFERAAVKVGLADWDEGEFGWHGTKSLTDAQAICWGNWDTNRRSGQACGPGEYFSRGTPGGLHYSEGYAGGDAGHLLIVAWIMSHERGAAPTNPAANGACGGTIAQHIVCQNPVKPGSRESTGEMYCFPVGVVAFGYGDKKPCFQLNAGGQLTSHPSGMDVNKSTDLVRVAAGAGSQCCILM